MALNSKVPGVSLADIKPVWMRACITVAFRYLFTFFCCLFTITSFSVQRTRGGRHGYSPVKQRSNSVEKYPTIQLPNISAVMSAIKNETHEQNNMEPADIVSVSMSPPSSDHNESTGSFTF